MSLLSDCKEYQDVIREFHISSVAEKFEFLRSLTNLFIVNPEGMAQCVAKDPKLAKLKSDELEQYVQMRDDFRSEFMHRFLS
jgi:hypothetical protein